MTVRRGPSYSGLSQLRETLLSNAKKQKQRNIQENIIFPSKEKHKQKTTHEDDYEDEPDATTSGYISSSHERPSVVASEAWQRQGVILPRAPKLLEKFFVLFLYLGDCLFVRFFYILEVHCEVKSPLYGIIDGERKSHRFIINRNLQQEQFTGG